MGFDVHVKGKVRVLVMGNARTHGVSLCLRAGGQILKIRSIKGKPTPETIVGMAVEMLREASV